VDRVVHLASPLATVTESEPREAVNSMIVPHLAILESARIAGVTKVVWASSVGVFGRPEDYASLPIPNDAPHRPLTLYGAAKSLMERMSERYTARYGLDTLGLRFPLVYGPARRRGGGQFTTRLIEGAALGQRCEIGDGDTRSDWMYVTDAARAVALALDAGRTSSRALTVGGEVGTSRDVAELLRRWFPTADLEIRPGAGSLVADYDPGPAFAEIGYRPTVTLPQGVLATVNAARRRSGLAEVS
jgi:nucleoside-diphosphate-sugar epimerase